MTRKEFLNLYGKLIIGSNVENFRFSGQFPELELWNEKEKKKIELYIDCEIISNDEKLNDLVEGLSKYNKDASILAYFIGVNNQKITSFNFTIDKNLILSFNNSIDLTFRIIDKCVEPLNISVSDNDKYLFGCMLFNDGKID